MRVDAWCVDSRAPRCGELAFLTRQVSDDAHGVDVPLSVAAKLVGMPVVELEACDLSRRMASNETSAAVSRYMSPMPPTPPHVLLASTVALAQGCVALAQPSP